MCYAWQCKRQIQAFCEMPAEGPVPDDLEPLNPPGCFGVFAQSIRKTYASRRPEKLLHSAFLNPCASAYIWTFLTAFLQFFLRDNQSLSTAECCVLLRAKINDVYLAMSFAIMRTRNLKDYKNETRHVEGRPAPQVDPVLRKLMSKPKGKSLGARDGKAETILKALPTILAYLRGHDKSLSHHDQAIATRLANFAEQVRADRAQLADIIDLFSCLQVFSVPLEDDFWFWRSVLHARGHVLVIEVHLYASEHGLSFEKCLERDHLRAIHARFFNDELPEEPEEESDRILDRMEEVLISQAGRDGKSNRADTARSADDYMRSNFRKVVFYWQTISAQMQDGASAIEADGESCSLWEQMSSADRKMWEIQHKLQEKIDSLMDREAFDAFVQTHLASLSGKFARAAVAYARTSVRRDPEALAERQGKLIERRRRAAQREALGLKRWQCEHKRQRSLCKECGGAGICEHKRKRSQCKECGGGSICEHLRIRSQCRDCGGGSICQHNRIRSRCKTCQADKDESMPPDLEEL